MNNEINNNNTIREFKEVIECTKNDKSLLAIWAKKGVKSEIDYKISLIKRRLEYYNMINPIPVESLKISKNFLNQLENLAYEIENLDSQN